jgi:chlorite dismutase
MDRHINTTQPFKGVRTNTSYSYGIDDQEFVDLVGRLRHTRGQQYTLRDTPMFTCAKAGIETILRQLGAS